MSERRPDRQADARRLRAQGMSRSDIAMELGVSRQSIWRWTKGGDADESGVTSVTPVTPVTPSQAPGAAETDAQAHDGRVLDWPQQTRADHASARAVLRERTAAGSVTAARDLAKITGAELARVNPCENHVDAVEANAVTQTTFLTMVSYLMDAGVRRLSHALDARLDLVAVEMDAIVGDVEGILNQLRAEAQEGG